MESTEKVSILTILLDKCQMKSFEGNEHSTQSNSKPQEYISKVCCSDKVHENVQRKLTKLFWV